MQTMRALLLSQYRHLELAELPVPVPGPDEVLVRVGACGICAGPISPEPGEGDVARDAVGHFLCNGCARGGARFSQDAGRALKALVARPITELEPLAAARGELDEVGALCHDLRRAFLGKELVSHGVVERMLAE